MADVKNIKNAKEKNNIILSIKNVSQFLKNK